jgi:malonyl CoA-acyl carrier protein transacylase
MKTAVVICPGRGTYNKTELGYLHRHFPAPELLAEFDAERRVQGQASILELDAAEQFSMTRHTRGDNASALIFASSLGDFLSIDRETIDIVAVTGNSMGWYTALACSGALLSGDGFRVANTMGALMQASLIGGQLVYPFTDDEWRARPERRAELLRLVRDIAAATGSELHVSIELGGMLVLAGNEAGLSAFEASVDRIQQRFPLRLGNHAAFHTPLMAPVSAQGQALLPPSLFRDPDIPIIDGRGAVWWPKASDPAELHAYTLGTQVVETYDFTRAITVAAGEFAPDHFIVLGPGNSLGGAVAQSLIQGGWLSMASKADFIAAQQSRNLLVSMGLPEQRSSACPV